VVESSIFLKGPHAVLQSFVLDIESQLPLVIYEDVHDYNTYHLSQFSIVRHHPVCKWSYCP
jgi:hypothetical protein